MSGNRDICNYEQMKKLVACIRFLHIIRKDYLIQSVSLAKILFNIECDGGVIVSIVAFLQAVDPGSIPGQIAHVFLYRTFIQLQYMHEILLLLLSLHYYLSIP
jgi:hypothetical protein